MNHGEYQYLGLLAEIMNTGVDKNTRNGTTRSLFARQLRFDLSKGFPALTTKKLAWKAVKSELLWFLAMKGKQRANDNDLKQLNESSKTIWTDNAESDYWKPKAHTPGDLGRVYGIQWRNWTGPHGEIIDQIEGLVEKLKKDPNDRRLIVSAWNPGELDDMALPPCHMFFQCYVANGKLSLHMTQRSCDMFLGVPFNIASYALLTHMLAHVTGLEAGELILTLNDAHIYHDHFEAVEEQLKREPHSFCQIAIAPHVSTIDGFTMNDVELVNYISHPAIKAKMAV